MIEVILQWGKLMFLYDFTNRKVATLIWITGSLFLYWCNSLSLLSSFSNNQVFNFSLFFFIQDVVFQWLTTEDIHLNQIDAEDPEVGGCKSLKKHFFLKFLKIYLLIMLLKLSRFPPSLHSILLTPSLPHSPPIVHVHGSYIEVLWLLHFLHYSYLPPVYFPPIIYATYSLYLSPPLPLPLPYWQPSMWSPSLWFCSCSSCLPSLLLFLF